ncbi:hypothetical protein J4Q44_G00224170 [Coregonus suidteri]|uniref:Kinesin-like protein KIF26A/B helical domain-containing protein n=1 Tax=Coregonus suidteri TaxID=861788 RepID=A0AAN8L9M9_9TELE
MLYSEWDHVKSLSLFPLQDPGYAAFLFDQLQVPGSHDGCCQVCSTPLHQLRQEALQTVALTLSHDMPALPSSTLSGQPHKLTLSSSSAHVRQPSKAHAHAHTILPLGESWHRGQGCPQGSSVSAGPKTSVQVTVGGGQLTGTLGSVTIQAQQYLEGMWSISRVNNFLPQPSPAQGLMGEAERDIPVPTSEAPVPSSSCSLTPSRQRSPVQLGQCDVAPPAPGPTSTPTPTSTQSASAAASFFIRGSVQGCQRNRDNSC